jgi:heterodisulfide reductase subunit A
VEGITGSVGRFTVTVRTHARYVKEDLCTACGSCAEKCPVEVPDEFEMGLANRKAIYSFFDQGVPAAFTIDPEHCIYLQRQKCGACLQYCDIGAIDFEQQDATLRMEVGAVIVAVGYDCYDPSPMGEYGFGRHRNVITSLQFERLISSAGPTGGEVSRPSDGGHARQIGFIQCVGSRDRRTNSYCSSVCCMYATKAAMLAAEHDPEVRSTIYYMDLRAGGKGFQEYIRRAREMYGVAYIRGRVAEIAAHPDDRLSVRYEDTETGELGEGSADLVVLCTALVPSSGIRDLAGRLGVDLDAHGFVASDPLFPVETSVPGIFACGYCREPVDIPDSVAEGSAAAAKAFAALTRARV